ncbi:methyltransferase [Phenylobacterium sp.]|uniref:methyltransferase n=1 Tax=Phenylobacterium sp. TaxID=1871053 RepID=UPI002F42E2B7
MDVSVALDLGRLDERASNVLGRLLEILKARRYAFITPTPETHARVLARPERHRAGDVHDVLGWNLPFGPELLDSELLTLLREAGVLVEATDGLRCTVRVASLGDELYLHSGFPPQVESVFFGPDTYRFARFLCDKLDADRSIAVLVDLGTGAGAGAVVAAQRVSPAQVILTDVNPRSLAVARINLACAGVRADFRCGHVLEPVTEPADLIIANPPFIAGDNGRIYSDGGDLDGARASLDWATAGSAQLTSGGRMLLYTGVGIIAGVDPLLNALRERLDAGRFELSYEEIDPDIFGESLDLEAYRDVDRIAAVGAVITRRTS